MPVHEEDASQPWLVDLNPEQLAAVTFGDGPLLVVAGAGSGKTRTLAHRVASLLARGVPPNRILLLTFTRRASQEMIRRAGQIAATASELSRVWGGTFHAIAHRLLRMYAESAGLSPDFTVMDQGDAQDVMNLCRHQLGYDDPKKMGERFPRKSTCLAIYSRCMAGAEDLDVVLERHFPWCENWQEELHALFRAYTQRKQEQMVLDYDDLLIYLEQLLDDDDMAREIGGMFDHVLVDEYQDTNPVQARILLGLRRFHPNIMVVGDDAQSIYGFRAATVRNILDFSQHFPGATIIKLEQNYRSVPEILKTTNQVISLATERYAKELWTAREKGERPKLVMCRDEAEQDIFVAETVLKHREEGIPLRKQAVLFRASHHADTLEVELGRRNIPYRKYGGLRFVESAHVKDLVCFLRILENPRDEVAWMRLLLLLPGVGPKTAERAWTEIANQAFRPEALKGFEAPPSAAPGIASLAALLHDLTYGGIQDPAGQVRQIRTFYDPLLTKLHDDAAIRRHDLEHLEQIASTCNTRQEFLSDLVLDPPTSTADLAGPPSLDEDWLVLSTIHSAKGGEWDAVTVIHASDGFLPSDMALRSPEEAEEELRLTYVALTRARDFLYVTWPKRYYHQKGRFTDRHTNVQLCRFLEPKAIKSTFDKVIPGSRRESDQRVTHQPRRDIAAKLRARWE